MMSRIDRGALYRLIGERLKEERISQKITQAVLAEKVGVLRTSIANIEAGKQKPPLYLLYEICFALNVGIDSVLPQADEVMARSSKSFIVGMKDAPKEHIDKLFKELIELENKKG